MRSILLAVWVLIGSVAPAVAGTATHAGLAIGDTVPALSYDEWIKGRRVTKLDAGTVYLVEFWGTWCEPCIANIPRLSRLQARYQKDGLVVIGIATHEFKGRAVLRRFMATKGRSMAYRVAFDADQSMERRWDTGGEPEVRFRMPLCFVIDRRGKVAFVGHPEDPEMEKSLATVIARGSSR